MEQSGCQVKEGRVELRWGVDTAARAPLTPSQPVAAYVPLTFHQRMGVFPIRHSSSALMMARRVAYPFEVLQRAGYLTETAPHCPK